MVLVDQVGQNINQLPEPKKRKRSLGFSLMLDALTVIFFSICVYAFINFPSMVLIGRYWINPNQVQYNFPSEQETKSQEVVVLTQEPRGAPGVKQYPDNTIFIPKIGVQAPVGWDTKTQDITDALEKNVVHLEGTGKPGDSDNIFITGHSSNYWWKKGDFNSVFALLPQLSENDEIVVTFKGEFHRYKVTGKEEMKKIDVFSRLAAGKEKLILMTCVPIGTNLNRLLIYAQPID